MNMAKVKKQPKLKQTVIVERTKKLIRKYGESFLGWPNSEAIFAEEKLTKNDVLQLPWELARADIHRELVQETKTIPDGRNKFIKLETLKPGDNFRTVDDNCCGTVIDGNFTDVKVKVWIGAERPEIKLFAPACEVKKLSDAEFADAVSYNRIQATSQQPTNNEPSFLEDGAMRIPEALARTLLEDLFPDLVGKFTKASKMQSYLNDPEKLNSATGTATTSPGRAMLTKILEVLANEGTVKVSTGKDEEVSTNGKATASKGTKGKGKKTVVKAGKGKKGANGRPAAAKKATPASGPWTPREGSTIELVLKMLKDGPVAKDKIITAVHKKFPDAPESGQAITVRWLIGVGLPRKGVKVEQSDKGFFVK
jgi:hypothetical protein